MVFVDFLHGSVGLNGGTVKSVVLKKHLAASPASWYGSDEVFNNTCDRSYRTNRTNRAQLPAGGS